MREGIAKLRRKSSVSEEEEIEEEVEDEEYEERNPTAFQVSVKVIFASFLHLTRHFYHISNASLEVESLNRAKKESAIGGKKPTHSDEEKNGVTSGMDEKRRKEKDNRRRRDGRMMNNEEIVGEKVAREREREREERRVGKNERLIASS
ncbi:hypothetical protein DBV15_05330 [Temnothorax longispinosus]|uniref:Uncharacterized protein n=1 Tax=Temnothorax longispinosus TaxID=300112 RepID=A0A4S2KY12_9HYME|nr:hypothetical protein DBV15_05330 [Temnothorax longispinosus]